MKERPIIFNTQMVQAILAGKKTQTRRVCKKTVYPYGEVGDELWVRETFNADWCDHVIYKADGGSAIEAGYKSEPKWKPSIFMPRKLSRIQLLIKRVRVEKIQDIKLNDIIKEGIIDNPGKEADHRIKIKWINLWNSINEKRGYGWNKNPDVWVIEFELKKENSNA